MGGTYCEENVVVVSITQHAMWHYANWQLYGKWQDNVAWRGLAGLMEGGEISLEAIRNGAKSKWWTNGLEEIKSHNCPEGWYSGRCEAVKARVSIKRTGSRDTEEVKRKKSEVAKGKKKSEAHKKSLTEAANKPERLTQYREGGRKLNAQKWMCLVTGKISTAGPLTIYQSANGIDPTLRVKLSTNSPVPSPSYEERFDK